jgi:hypothetical protein
VNDATPSRSADPIPVALALLDQHWPDGPALAEVAGRDAATALERDPRYIIGRLQQALATLLAADLPPMDPQTSLLSQALADAIAWRHHDDRPCPRCADSLCDPCNADWDQADRYHTLARALGAIGDPCHGAVRSALSPATGKASGPEPPAARPSPRRCGLRAGCSAALPEAEQDGRPVVLGAARIRREHA